MLAITFISVSCYAPKDFEFIWFYNIVVSSVPDECYWAYLMNVIERTWWMLLSVPDECYSERTWWMLFWAYLMKVILSVPDEYYSDHTRWMLFWAYLMNVILSVPDECYYERTWWMLFQKLVVCTKLDIYVFLFNLHYSSAYICPTFFFHHTVVLWSVRVVVIHL